MMKKIFTSLLIVYLNIYYTFAEDAGFLGISKIQDNIRGTKKPLVDAIELYIAYLLTFLYFMAVVIGLYAGFKILTANGDDEQVKKGKTIIIMVIGGIVIIFLAGMIASFFLHLFVYDNLQTGTGSTIGSKTGIIVP